MAYSNNKSLKRNEQLSGSYLISIILSTENPIDPVYQTPANIKRLIPQDISSEILVVHYNQSNNHTNTIAKSNSINTTETSNEKSNNKLHIENILHVRISGEIGSAFMKGLELSTGQFILIMDADYPYPDEVVVKMIGELIEFPNSILIASRYADNKNKQKLPFVRNTISKGARIIVRHGLKVKDVKDPLSGCFATSRRILENVMIESKGNQILLEVLVKGNKYNKENEVTVKEIPFEQKNATFLKKLDLNRIVSYTKAVWHLYRYGRKSHWMANESEIIEQKKHKSVLFLSKAGRFFTVGASGLVINYLVSLLLSNIVPNIWYIHATFVGIIVSISTNFVLNKVWTFEDWDFSIKHFLRQYGLFLLLCSFGAGIQLFLVSIFVDYYHIQYSVSLIMAVCIASIGNFLLNKKITFGEKIWE